jgi:alkylation response protein AidB-like acyl-CoA dehydrogenase
VDLDWSDEQRAWHDGAVEFARRHLCRDVAARDAAQEFDREGFLRCAEFGLLGLPVPKEYGGLGLGLTEVLAVMEGLGYGGRDAGLLFSVNAHLWTNTIPLARFGSEEQKRTWLPGLCDGSLVGANGASEPDAGSDVFALSTRAEKRDGGYVLTGTKTFVTNAPVAGLFVVYATLDRRLGPLGITGFLVERGQKGLSVGKTIGKMGLRTSPMAELVLDGVEVPAENRLGREGRGVEVFECSMEWERGAILASGLGVMRRQLERCVDHARTRRQFGQPIGKFQAVAAKIVDMKLRLETARALVRRIGVLKDRGLDATAEAALAKLHVSDSMVKNGLDALQVFGGYGYTTEYELERELRDAIGSTLYSGTSEIQRNIVARSLGIG